MKFVCRVWQWLRLVSQCVYLTFKVSRVKFPDFLKANYTHAMSNIEKLRNRESKVMHGIDATNISNHHLLGEMKFDRIIFNFPYAGFFKHLSREAQLWWVIINLLFHREFYPSSLIQLLVILLVNDIIFRLYCNNMDKSSIKWRYFSSYAVSTKHLWVFFSRMLRSWSVKMVKFI